MFFCMTSTRLALNVSKKRFHFVVLNQRERMCSYHFKVHKCCSLCYSPKKLKKMPFLFVLFCHFFCQNRAIFLLLWLFPANVKSLPILFLPILCAKNVPSFLFCNFFLSVFKVSFELLMQTGAGLTFPPENVTLKCTVRNQLFCRKTKKLKNRKDVSSEILIYKKPCAKLNFVLHIWV